MKMTIAGDNDGDRQQLNGSTSPVSVTRLKRRITNKNRDRPQLDDLPVELLQKIFMCLTIADLFSFGRVSRNWRNLAVSSKREFLEAQGPLVVVISSRATRTCFFFDVAARIAFKTKLPKFCGRLCVGISSGYVLMQSPAFDLMLANPLTGQKVEFPEMILPAPRPRMTSENDRCIFACTYPQPDFLAVVLSSRNWGIHFRRSRDSEWTFFSFVGNLWLVRDIIAFGSRIFVLSYDAQIGMLSLRSPPTMDLLFLRDKPEFSPFVSLVASRDELLAVDFYPGRTLKIYRVDFAGCQWVRVFDLGNRSLFLSNLKSSRICGTTRWGGRPNCIYHLQAAECVVYSLASPFIAVDRFPIVPKIQSGAARVSYGWYLPSEFDTIDYVWDDQVGAVAEDNAQN